MASAAPPIGLPREPEAAEPLARFILDKSKFAATTGRIKYQAFMPTSAGHTSVFRVANLTADAIWAIGRVEVADPQGKRLLGRGDITVEHVKRVGLKVDADDNPPRHANIEGWPPEKDARISMAQELAACATLTLCEN